jgi:hypothetical protein
MKSFITGEVEKHGKFKTYGLILLGSVGTMAFFAIMYVAFFAVAFLFPGA